MNNTLNKVQNEFLGGITSIVVENQEQFEQLKEFMSIRNLFQRDGTPISRLNMIIQEPVAFFRNYTQACMEYGTVLEAERDYKIATYNQAFAEQMNFFGNGGIVKQPSEDLVNQGEERKMDEQKETIEVETTSEVVSEEVSLVEVINTLEVTEVTPASIKENITANKEKLLQAIKQRSNIVVTKDNFVEMKAVRADLNKKKDYLIEQRVKVKKEASSKIDEFIESVTEIVKAIENVILPLDTDIKKYEAEAKKELKQKIIKRDIKPLLDAGVSAGYFTQEIADKFVFDSSWTNASALTQAGALTKKTQEAVNTEMNRLMTLYQIEQKDIESIKADVVQLKTAYNLDAGIDPQRYIDFYMGGKSMPEVKQMITDDINLIKSTAQKQADKIVSEQQTAQQDQIPQNQENVSQMPSQSTIVDDKTGEVLGKFNGKQILADMAIAPQGYEDKVFDYTYQFSGPCAVIMTFNKILKLLSKINPQFKFEKVGK